MTVIPCEMTAAEPPLTGHVTPIFEIPGCSLVIVHIDRVLRKKMDGMGDNWIF
jgi:hypothetical protein